MLRMGKLFKVGGIKCCDFEKFYDVKLLSLNLKSLCCVVVVSKCCIKTNRMEWVRIKKLFDKKSLVANRTFLKSCMNFKFRIR